MVVNTAEHAGVKTARDKQGLKLQGLLLQGTRKVNTARDEQELLVLFSINPCPCLFLAVLMIDVLHVIKAEMEIHWRRPANSMKLLSFVLQSTDDINELMNFDLNVRRIAW